MPIVKKVEAIPEPSPPQWWDRFEPHPMTDTEFVEAFCSHVLLTTKDRSLQTVRDRAFRFIRNFMSPQMEEQLTEYRKGHRHD